MEASKATTFFCFALVFLYSLAVASAAGPFPPHDVTALFAFGDSTLDPGNNNHLNTIFRSDHPPYGRNLPNHTPTGRFCDGRLTTDFMASWLGLKPLLPAYFDPTLTDADLMTGASFASAGGGLDDATAQAAGVMTMDVQLNNFAEAVRRIERRVGPADARRIVSNALYVISAGTNDVVDTFYGLPNSPRRLQFGNSISTYHDFLLQRLQHVIETLHNMGARRFAVAGMPPVGCLPMQVQLTRILRPGPGRGCVQDENRDSEDYNKKLQTLVSQLNSNLQGINVAYGDAYNPMVDMIRNPAKYGFENLVQGCCGLGTVAAGPLCMARTPTCSDPSKYLFWDSIHPSEAANSYLARSFESNAFPGLS